MRKILLLGLAVVLAAAAHAQSGTNSPYSQYALGVQSDNSNSFSRGMNGLALGFREGNTINSLNPASYSALDSLSFIFDAAVSGQITNFNEAGVKKNANNANFEFVNAGLRLARHLGMSFGLMPYTNIGYNYSSTRYVDDTQSTTCAYTYSGSGGLHHVYLGLGWEIFHGLSIGVNAGYMWGELSHSIVNSYSDSYVNTLSRYYTAEVRNYKVDFGLQYSLNVGKEDNVTIGATYGLGHKLNSDATLNIVSNNSQTGVADSLTLTAADAYEVPTTIGAGFAWKHGRKWAVGADYTLQKWSSTSYPVYSENGSGTPTYAAQAGTMSDRHKVVVGGMYCPKYNGRSIIQRTHYRAGVGYATPYLKINGKDGPKELSASVGLGIPITNQYNNRSTLNISAQWTHRNATDMIKENTFRVTIGMNFDERWFAKWKLK